MTKTIPPEHDPASHYLGQGDDTAAFFLTLDTINFGSGYFPYMNKRPGRSGYFTVAGRLNDRFKKRPRKTAPAYSGKISKIDPLLSSCGFLPGL
jgi:hypothetical protein